MPTCERCWRDAYLPGLEHELGQAGAYHELLRTRDCTPEQQAGRRARWCVPCGRQTSHEVCDVCVLCGRKDQGVGGRLEDFG